MEQNLNLTKVIVWRGSKSEEYFYPTIQALKKDQGQAVIGIQVDDVYISGKQLYKVIPMGTFINNITPFEETMNELYACSNKCMDLKSFTTVVISLARNPDFFIQQNIFENIWRSLFGELTPEILSKIKTISDKHSGNSN